VTVTYSAEIVGKLEQPDRDGMEETGLEKWRLYKRISTF